VRATGKLNQDSITTEKTERPRKHGKHEK